jgi:hypothetical protein
MSHPEYARQLKEAGEGLQREAQCLLQPWRALQAASQALREQSTALRQTYTSKTPPPHRARASSRILASQQQCPDARGDSEGCYG